MRKGKIMNLQTTRTAEVLQLMSERMSDSSILCLCYSLFTLPHWKNKRHLDSHTYCRTKSNVQKNAKALFITI